MKRTLSIIIAFSSLFLVCSLAGATTANLRLSPQGEIIAWLVLGPLPNDGTPHEDCPGFRTDYLAESGGEAKASPSELDSVRVEKRKRSWQLVLTGENAILDLAWANRLWERQSVSYAYMQILSPKPREVELRLGSDDGVKVWVNGKLSVAKHVRRGLNRDEDRVRVLLNAGTNRFLFKVDQGVGEWSLQARLMNMDGTPARDLVETLAFSDGETPTSPSDDPYDVVRSMMRTPGSLDVFAAIQYQNWLQKAQPWSVRMRDEIKNPKPLDTALKECPEQVAKAEKLDADHASMALNAAVARIQREYQAAREKIVRKYENPSPLFEADPLKEDYVRIAPGGRYFVHADGSPFIPIGYNHNPDWSKLIESNPEWGNYDPKVTDAYFAHLRESGVNVVRLMIETPGSGCIEDPIGTFRPEHIRWIDHIVRAAQREKIKLMVTPWDTFWMIRRWGNNPYNSAVGGPVQKEIDFITKREVVEAQKRRLQYMIDRWGNSGTVFCWELLNEANLYWGATPEQLSAWSKEMADFVRSYEKKRWGRQHLVTVSISEPMPRDGLGDVAYRHPEFDLATTHLYLGAANAPKEAVGPAEAIHEGVEYALKAIKDNRPYIDGEDGPINEWIRDDKLDDEVFHNMSWAHLSSGGAGSAFRWPYRNPHHLSEGMLQALSCMAKFVERVPWNRFGGSYEARPHVDAPEGWLAYATGSDKAAIVWALARDGKAAANWKLSGTWAQGPAKIRCRFFDTKNGAWNGEKTVEASEGRFSIELPQAPASTAMILEQANP